MYLAPLEGGESGDRATTAVEGGAVGALLGGLLKS